MVFSDQTLFLDQFFTVRYTRKLKTLKFKGSLCKSNKKHDTGIRLLEHNGSDQKQIQDIAWVNTEKIDKGRIWGASRDVWRIFFGNPSLAAIQRETKEDPRKTIENNM